MALDVPVPDPPDLSNRGNATEFREVQDLGSSADFRREELEEVFHDGAWHEAFAEWWEYTDLSESDLAVVDELGLFREFDFYWDSTDGRLRFDAPSVPEDVDADALPDAVAAETTTINTALEEFGQTVIELVVDAYLDWGEAEPSDYVWDEETFGEGIDRGD